MYLQHLGGRINDPELAYATAVGMHPNMCEVVRAEAGMKELGITSPPAHDQAYEQYAREDDLNDTLTRSLAQAAIAGNAAGLAYLRERGYVFITRADIAQYFEGDETKAAKQTISQAWNQLVRNVIAESSYEGHRYGGADNKPTLLVMSKVGVEKMVADNPRSYHKALAIRYLAHIVSPDDHV